MNDKGRVPGTHGPGMKAEEPGELGGFVEHAVRSGGGLEVMDVIPSDRQRHFTLVHASCFRWLRENGPFDLILTDSLWHHTIDHMARIVGRRTRRRATGFAEGPSHVDETPTDHR